LALVILVSNRFADNVQFTDPQAALDHAMTLHREGRHAQAEEIYRQLLAAFPDSTDILHLLGLAEIDLGREIDGFAKLREAIRLNPSVPHYHANLGARLLDRSEPGEAEIRLREAIRLQPDEAVHHYNLGNALLKLRRHDEAVAAFEQSCRLRPDYPDRDLQLGIALHAAGRRSEATDWYRTALSRHPGHIAILTNLGAMLQEACDLDGAAECFRRALAHDPSHVVPLNNLAVLLKEQGEISEATRLLRRCVELHPAGLELRSNLILTLHYDPTAATADLVSAHEGWNRLQPTPRIVHANRPEPGRRLRLGFVSPDLRDHVVGRALLPSFRRFDPGSFELYCYANPVADAVGEEFRSRSQAWRELGTKTAGQLAETIAADGVDILIDLALHTSDNRLDVFALKPAPLQVAWLGYPESSGVATMDYRLTDAWLEPPTGNALAHAQEKAWLIPDCWTCYEPPPGHPEVNALPSTSGRPLTFGSFNNNSKINGAVLDAWARLLLATPGSRLQLLAKQGGHRRRFADEFSRRGVDAARILFADYMPASADLSQGALLQRYHDIDVALDTFPYGGMTTTLDALWMGVPVVSLVGERNLGRAGLSLLNNVGLGELATKDVEGYVETARRLALDPVRLAALRGSLRGRMQKSPLLDAAGYTRKVEQAFRDMWVDWCAGQAKVG
jgi:predicted O-linked N-acetylglucosamine transferase (SPINDLY family)